MAAVVSLFWHSIMLERPEVMHLILPLYIELSIVPLLI